MLYSILICLLVLIINSFLCSCRVEPPKTTDQQIESQVNPSDTIDDTPISEPNDEQIEDQLNPGETRDITCLDTNKDYIATAEILFDFRSSDTNYYTIQGAYFNGDKYFVATIYKNASKVETVRILVLDKDGTPIRESNPLPLDHANNVTFNSKINKLVVSHCQSEDGHYYRYSFVDPDTLEITKTDDLKYPFFSMAYSPEKDMYASAEWSGQTLDTWDGNMKNVLRKNVEMPKSLSQGVFCDKNAIYFVRSSQNNAPAEIRIYDWNCNLVRTILLELPGSIEPESINIVGGKTYVIGTNWSTQRGVAFCLTYKAINEINS